MVCEFNICIYKSGGECEPAGFLPSLKMIIKCGIPFSVTFTDKAWMHSVTRFKAKLPSPSTDRQAVNLFQNT